MSLDKISPLLSILKPTTQSILVQLWARKINDEVTASHADLSAWTGIKSKNTVRSAIRELLDRGWVKMIKPGQEGSPSIYRLSLGGKSTHPSPPSSTLKTNLTPENHLLLAAIKRSLSPAAWNSVRREASLTGESEDTLIVRKYFGPERLNG